MPNPDQGQIQGILVGIWTFLTKCDSQVSNFDCYIIKSVKRKGNLLERRLTFYKKTQSTENHIK
jgi:hypothetical protein